jgi:phosphoserine phosphatase
MAKHIYFVRHGQSEYNLSDVALPHDTALTPLGLAQAEECAKRCASLDVEVIFASTYQRAWKTAEAIQQKNNKPLIKDEVFLEYRYPDGIIGVAKKGGPDHLKMIGGTEMSYPGGELFHEIHARALSALMLLESREEQSMLVVSHSFFLHALLNAIMFGENASFREFERICSTMRLSNTGITHCIFDPEKKVGKRWKVITWNDDVHLGETHQ